MVTEKDSNGQSTVVDVIAGNLKGVQAPKPTPDSWAANSDHLVSVLTIKMAANARWTLPAAAAEANRSLYFYRGSKLILEGQTIDENHLVHLKANEEVTLENGDQEGYLLVLQGKPINEPVAQHGPFVMNTQEEIRQAMMDYQKTEFGGWPWSEREQVHDRKKGRFALHADGREEIK